MKSREVFSTFFALDEKDRENLIPMLTNFFLIVIGTIFWLLVNGWKDFGMGLAIAAFVSLSPLLLFFVDRKLRRMKDIEGVMKVALRGEPLYVYLKPELHHANEISLVGNVLRKDFFRQHEFLEIVKTRKSDGKLRLRVCIYRPNRSNRMLEIRARDEESDKILAIMGCNLTQEEKTKKIDELVNTYMNHMIGDIDYMLDSFRDLKADPDLSKKLELRFIDSNYITDSVLIAGNKVVVCDYLHQGGTNTPYLVLRGGEVAKKYRDDFERVWKLASAAD